MKSLILQSLEDNKCQNGEICLGLWLTPYMEQCYVWITGQEVEEDIKIFMA